jgi:hypothetical protein
VGLRAGLDTVSKRKIPRPRRESKPRTPIFDNMKIIATLNISASEIFIHGFFKF